MTLIASVDGNIISNLIVPYINIFGSQEIQLDTAELVVASAEEITNFCGNGGESVWNFSSSMLSILAVPQWFNPQKLNCNYAFETDIPSNYLSHWCRLNVTILRVATKQYPGIYASGHPADKYQTLLNANPAWNSCNIFDTRIDPEILPAGNFGVVSMYSDPSPAKELFTSSFIFWLFRFLALFYFGVAFYAGYFFYRRFRSKSLTKTHLAVLLLNIGTNATLGFFEAAGNKWIDSGSSILSDTLLYSTYTCFSASSLSGDLFLSILYSSAKQTDRMNCRVRNRNRRFFSFAIVLIAVEILISVSIVVGQRNDVIFIMCIVVIPVVLLLLQIVMSVFMYLHAKGMINHLQVTIGLAAGPSTRHTVYKPNASTTLLSSLESNLRKCTMLAVTSSAVFCSGLLYFCLFGVPDHSPVAWVIFWWVLNMANAFSGLAQVLSCKIIKRPGSGNASSGQPQIRTIVDTRGSARSVVIS